jgi:hypothetical protein
LANSSQSTESDLPLTPTLIAIAGTITFSVAFVLYQRKRA